MLRANSCPPTRVGQRRGSRTLCRRCQSPRRGSRGKVSLGCRPRGRSGENAGALARRAHKEKYLSLIHI
eukprot:10015780-Alexandrium_andersonii.AAC.1